LPRPARRDYLEIHSSRVSRYVARRLQKIADRHNGADQIMAQHWNFEQDEQQQWHWQHLEGSEKSSNAFASATECMLDAVRHVVKRRRADAVRPGKDLLQ
jgi:hypothetical protein